MAGQGGEGGLLGTILYRFRADAEPLFEAFKRIYFETETLKKQQDAMAESTNNATRSQSLLVKAFNALRIVIGALPILVFASQLGLLGRLMIPVKAGLLGIGAAAAVGFGALGKGITNAANFVGLGSVLVSIKAAFTSLGERFTWFGTALAKSKVLWAGFVSILSKVVPIAFATRWSGALLAVYTAFEKAHLGALLLNSSLGRLVHIMPFVTAAASGLEMILRGLGFSTNVFSTAVGVSNKALLGFLGTIAAFIAIAGVVINRVGQGMRDTVQGWTAAFAQAQMLQFGLTVAIESFARRTGDASLKVDELAKKVWNLSQITGISALEMKQGLIQMLDLANVTKLSGQNIDALLVRMADFATVAHQDFLNVVYGVDQAMRGWSQTLQSMGLRIDQSSAQQTEYAKALRKSWQEMTQAERTQAMFNDVMEQTASFAGKALLSTTVTIEGAMRRFHATLQRVHQEMGRGAVTVWKPYYILLQQLTRALAAIPDSVWQFIGGLTAMASTVLIVVGTFLKWSVALGMIYTAWKLLGHVIGESSFIVKLGTRFGITMTAFTSFGNMIKWLSALLGTTLIVNLAKLSSHLPFVGAGAAKAAAGLAGAGAAAAAFSTKVAPKAAAGFALTASAATKTAVAVTAVGATTAAVATTASTAGAAFLTLAANLGKFLVIGKLVDIALISIVNGFARVNKQENVLAEAGQAYSGLWNDVKDAVGSVFSLFGDVADGVFRLVSTMAQFSGSLGGAVISTEVLGVLWNDLFSIHQEDGKIVDAMGNEFKKLVTFSDFLAEAWRKILAVGELVAQAFTAAGKAVAHMFLLFSRGFLWVQKIGLEMLNWPLKKLDVLFNTDIFNLDAKIAEFQKGLDILDDANVALGESFQRTAVNAAATFDYLMGAITEKTKEEIQNVDASIQGMLKGIPRATIKKPGQRLSEEERAAGRERLSEEFGAVSESRSSRGGGGAAKTYGPVKDWDQMYKNKLISFETYYEKYKKAFDDAVLYELATTDDLYQKIREKYLAVHTEMLQRQEAMDSAEIAATASTGDEKMRLERANLAKRLALQRASLTAAQGMTAEQKAMQKELEELTLTRIPAAESGVKVLGAPQAAKALAKKTTLTGMADLPKSMQLAADQQLQQQIAAEKELQALEARRQELVLALSKSMAQSVDDEYTGKLKLLQMTGELTNADEAILELDKRIAIERATTAGGTEGALKEEEAQLTAITAQWEKKQKDPEKYYAALNRLSEIARIQQERNWTRREAIAAAAYDWETQLEVTFQREKQRLIDAGFGEEEAARIANVARDMAVVRRKLEIAKSVARATGDTEAENRIDGELEYLSVLERTGSASLATAAKESMAFDQRLSAATSYYRGVASWTKKVGDAGKAAREDSDAQRLRLLADHEREVQKLQASGLSRAAAQRAVELDAARYHVLSLLDIERGYADEKGRINEEYYSAKARMQENWDLLQFDAWKTELEGEANLHEIREASYQRIMQRYAELYIAAHQTMLERGMELALGAVEIMQTAFEMAMTALLTQAGTMKDAVKAIKAAIIQLFVRWVAEMLFAHLKALIAAKIANAALIKMDTARATSAAPAAIATSISSYGAAAATGLAAYMLAIGLGTAFTATLAGAAGTATAMAKGGVVSKPTFALIGEGKQAEAVLPLDKFQPLVKALENAVRINTIVKEKTKEQISAPAANAARIGVAVAKAQKTKDQVSAPATRAPLVTPWATPLQVRVITQVVKSLPLAAVVPTTLAQQRPVSRGQSRPLVAADTASVTSIREQTSKLIMRSTSVLQRSVSSVVSSVVGNVARVRESATTLQRTIRSGQAPTRAAATTPTRAAATTPTRAAATTPTRAAASFGRVASVALDRFIRSPQVQEATPQGVEARLTRIVRSPAADRVGGRAYVPPPLQFQPLISALDRSTRLNRGLGTRVQRPAPSPSAPSTINRNIEVRWNQYGAINNASDEAALLRKVDSTIRSALL